MLLRITAERQGRSPAHVLDEMDVGQRDKLELTETPDGYPLRPRRIDYSRLGALRRKRPDKSPPFDIRTVRDHPYDPALRQQWPEIARSASIPENRRRTIAVERRNFDQRHHDT